MKPIESINYSVFFENSLQELSAFLNQKKYSKVFVLVDSNTEIQCFPTLQKALGAIEFDLI
jgi:3-dehydroquinate synthase